MVNIEINLKYYLFLHEYFTKILQILIVTMYVFVTYDTVA